MCQKQFRELNSHLLVFFFRFQGVRGALNRYVRFQNHRGGWDSPRRLVDNPTENYWFCALLRSESVTRLEPETIPMELKTMCRIPGMREMLRKFQGRLHLRAWGTIVPGNWLLLQFVTLQARSTNRTQSLGAKISKGLFWDHVIGLLLDCVSLWDLCR